MLFIAVRGKLAAYNKPAIYATTERVRQCVEMITGSTLLELGLRMEAYCIGGLDSTDLLPFVHCQLADVMTSLF